MGDGSMSSTAVQCICDLDDDLTFLSPGETIRYDSFGNKYSGEMNGRMGRYATLSEDEARIFDENPRVTMMF